MNDKYQNHNNKNFGFWILDNQRTWQQPYLHWAREKLFFWYEILIWSVCILVSGQCGLGNSCECTERVKITFLDMKIISSEQFLCSGFWITNIFQHLTPDSAGQCGLGNSLARSNYFSVYVKSSSSEKFLCFGFWNIFSQHLAPILDQCGLGNSLACTERVCTKWSLAHRRPPCPYLFVI